MIKYDDKIIYKCISKISKEYGISRLKIKNILKQKYPEFKPKKYLYNLISSDLELEFRFKQPFDSKFTNIKDKNFIDFTRSDDIKHIYTQTKFVTSAPDKTIKFIENIFDDKIYRDSFCIFNLYFFAYNNQNLNLLLRKYEYLEPLVKYTNTAEEMAFAFSAECFDNIHNDDRDLCDLLANLNKKSINSLKLCLNNKNATIVRLHLSFLIISENAPEVKMRQEQTLVAHSSQLIINVKENKAYILESSINDSSNSKSQKLETIKDISTEVFLKHYLDKNIKVEELDLNECPSVNLQGNTSLCGTWSLYLFILTILNPTIDRYIMYDIFSQYIQFERDSLILKFMYWIFKFNKYKGIALPEHIVDGVIPQL
jgi:hypothetical protein